MKSDKEEIQYMTVDSEQYTKIKCYWRYSFLFLFFCLGLINNLGYVLILTGASQLSKKFDNDNLNALYLLSLIICSSLAKFINSKYLIKISYIKRITILSLYFLTGYLSLFFILNSIDGDESFNKTQAFFLSLIPSFIMGTGSAFGEATILGYLRNFPKDFVSGWSSGTGMAGVIGATVTLSFHIADIKPKLMYLIISPVCIIYLISFILIERLYKKYLKNMRNGLLDQDFVDNLETANNEDVSQNKSFNCKNALAALKKSWRFIFNLASVYYLEYTILSGFGERVAAKGYIIDADKDFVYEYFSLSYQIGVFISRSSLIIVKNIKFVELFSFVQFINFIIWLFNAYFGFIDNVYIAVINFVIVGLMGGAAYVACFYFILNNDKIENDLKELTVNIASIFNDFGIFLASISVLIFDNFIIKSN